MSATPNLVAYADARPVLLGEVALALPGHAVIGRVTLGRGARLGAGSVIRADGHYVRAGDDLELGRGATVHIAHDLHPTLIGERVCVGADAVVHACTLGDEVVVEEGAVVLDGARVGDGVVLEAHSVVFPRSVLEPGTLYSGSPARPLRRLDSSERAERARALRSRNAADAAAADWPCRTLPQAAAAEVFVAATACLQGQVRLGQAGSVWYGCRLDANAAPIELGARCNVQDNSQLLARGPGIVLGEDTTVGHNVHLADCSVGARCLIGMGSRIAAGTVIADDTFVAAGCTTLAGQRLDGGLVWGGRPARVLGELDQTKRRLVLLTVQTYREYARVLGQAQRA